METKNKLYSLEYYKHKCKVQQKQIEWLDYLADFEREVESMCYDDITEMTMREKELWNDFDKEEKEFNKIYNI